MNRILLLASIVMLAGCASPYNQYYSSSGYRPALDPNAIAATGKPELRTGTDLLADQKRMAEDGYRLIGMSNFNGGEVDPSKAVAQAEEVKASVVIVYARYSNTVQGAVAFTPPTSYTNMSGLASGRSLYGNAQPTTNRTIHRYDHIATYWGKIRPGIFGAFLDQPTVQERRIAGTNRGIIVKAVIKGSPAFKADILQNDIIYRMNETDVYDGTSMNEALQRLQGQKVSVSLIRGGVSKTLDVQLNKSWQ